MVGFELLSPALVSVLNQAILSENLVKYLYYNNIDPLSQPAIVDSSILLNKSVFPAPFDNEITWDDCSQLRVFYLSGQLQDNMVVDGTKVIFDIVCAKSLWMISGSQIRPYQIMAELEKQLRGVSVPIAGKLVFKTFHHMAVDKQFDAIRLIASMTLFSDGK
jgi:hypothetical protein